MRPLEPSPDAAKLLTGEARRLLAALVPALDGGGWREEPLSKARCASFAAEHGTALGAVAQPLRVALTGSRASPGIFAVMAVLGREETLGRIADAVGMAG